MPGTGNAGLIFSDDFETEACGAACSNLKNWTVARGNVDVVNSIGTFGPFPGNAKFLDLDGSTSIAAKLVSKQAFSLAAGTAYTLSFDLAGSHRGTQTDTVTYGLDVDGNGSLDFFDSQTLAPAATFAVFSLVFTATAPSGTARIVFDHAGADYVGLLLDNVSFSANPPTSVPEPASLALLGAGLAGWLAGRRRAEH